MKGASKVFYIIGIITNVILIIAWATFIIIPIVGLSNAEFIDQIASQSGQSAEFVKSALTALSTVSGVSIVFSIVVFVLSIIAIKQLNDGKGKKSAHVLLLIGGILSLDLFYILGSAFGLAAAAKDSK